MNIEDYAAAIPSWCGAGVDERMEMLLCWSLAAKVEKGQSQPREHCNSCPMLRGMTTSDEAGEVGK